MPDKIYTYCEITPADHITTKMVQEYILSRFPIPVDWERDFTPNFCAQRDFGQPIRVKEITEEILLKYKGKTPENTTADDVASVQKVVEHALARMPETFPNPRWPGTKLIWVHYFRGVYSLEQEGYDRAAQGNFRGQIRHWAEMMLKDKKQAYHWGHNAVADAMREKNYKTYVNWDTGTHIAVNDVWLDEEDQETAGLYLHKAPTKITAYNRDELMVVDFLSQPELTEEEKRIVSYFNTTRLKWWLMFGLAQQYYPERTTQALIDVCNIIGVDPLSRRL